MNTNPNVEEICINFNDIPKFSATIPGTCYANEVTSKVVATIFSSLQRDLYAHNSPNAF